MKFLIVQVLFIVLCLHSLHKREFTTKRMSMSFRMARRLQSIQASASVTTRQIRVMGPMSSFRINVSVCKLRQ
jgi:hypothetical protein